MTTTLNSAPAVHTFEFFKPTPPMPADNGHVQLYQAYLDLAAMHGQMLYSFLSDEERARAARLRFAGDRQHFIAARGILRLLLGQWMGATSPADVHFQTTPLGKPSLAAGSNPLGIQFSLSHSHGLALYAFARGPVSVGIDIEKIDDTVDIAAMIDHVVPRERWAAIHDMTNGQRRVALFSFWTKLEAIAKASGAGLSGVRDIRESDWNVTTFTPVHGYVAALAWGAPHADARDVAAVHSIDSATLGARSFNPNLQ